MNNAPLNHSGINGSSLAAWVIFATAIATATASSVACDSVRNRPGRVTSAQAVATIVNANAVLVKKANSTSSAGAIGLAQPNIIYSGRCNVVATATGQATIPHLVPATATGSATATATANAAQALGESLATTAATIVQANGTRIQRGASTATAAATGVAINGDVTRHPLVSAAAGVAYTRAEGSIKLSGDSFYSHDGYVIARDGAATCVATIDQTLMKTVLTGGIGGTGACESTAAAFVKMSANSYAESLSIDGYTINLLLHTKYGAATATAASVAAANGVKRRPGSAIGSLADSTATAKALMKYAGRAASTGESAIVFTASPTRIRKGMVTGDLAAAALVSSTFGYQYFAESESLAELAGEAGAVVIYQASANGTPGNAQSAAQGTLILMASVDVSMATALNIKATGMTNSDVKAPDGRYMTVQEDDRIMIVPFEERTLLVAA